MEYPPPTCNSPLAKAVGNAWAFPVEASESSDAREPTIIQFLSIPYSWEESKLPSCHISSTIGATSKAERPFARLLREQNSPTAVAEPAGPPRYLPESGQRGSRARHLPGGLRLQARRQQPWPAEQGDCSRSEERRVGKERRSRWAPYS